MGEKINERNGTLSCHLHVIHLLSMSTQFMEPACRQAGDSEHKLYVRIDPERLSPFIRCEGPLAPRFRYFEHWSSGLFRASIYVVLIFLNNFEEMSTILASSYKIKESKYATLRK